MFLESDDVDPIDTMQFQRQLDPGWVERLLVREEIDPKLRLQSRRLIDGDLRLEILFPKQAPTVRPFDDLLFVLVVSAAVAVFIDRCRRFRAENFVSDEESAENENDADDCY